jgi:hypothetical protein
LFETDVNFSHQQFHADRQTPPYDRAEFQNSAPWPSFFRHHTKTFAQPLGEEASLPPKGRKWFIQGELMRASLVIVEGPR